MRRDLNPQTLRLTAERATYLRHTSIFLNGRNLHPPITYSHSHMLNGAYGNRTRRLLLAKQASPHCDLYPIFAGSIPAGIFNLPAIHFFNPVFKLNGNFIRISGLVRCIWKMSHLNNLSLFLMPSFTLLTFLFIPVFCPANIAFPKCSLFHFFCSFSRMFFSLHLQYARIFKNAEFFADYFFWRFLCIFGLCVQPRTRQNQVDGRGIEPPTRRASTCRSSV